jgi:hypothetical protein
MKRGLVVTAACLAVFLCSCATQVAVKITKPAEINMSGARRIAVLDFDYPREARAEGLFGLLYLYMNNYDNVRTDTIEYKMAKYTTDKLILALIDTNYFTIVSSKDVLAKMVASGSRDLSAAEIGRQSEAQAIVAGEIVSINRDRSHEYRAEQVKDPQTGVIRNISVLYSTVVDSVSMTYRVVSTQTGQTIATKMFSDKETQTEKGDYSQLASQEDQCRKIIARWIPLITKQIAPYQVTEYRALVADKSKNPDMKAADTLVKDAAYDKALALYLHIWSATKNPAAGTNAAIVYDIVGRLDEALSQIDQVVAQSGDKNAIKEQARLRQLKIENDRLVEQMK